MSVLITLLGVALNAIVLRDIFFSVFSPRGSGTLSSSAIRYAWHGFRWGSRGHPDRLDPIFLVLTILLWIAGLVLGWACIFWPHLPDQFLLSTGLVPDRNAGFLDAVYVSMVTLGTLGYGEMTPQTTWLRIVAPLEGLIGFALFTASVSWFMSIYPSLARRRNLAREIALLARRAESTDCDLTHVVDPAMLQQLTRQVLSARDDFVQYPVTYYFRNADHASALDMALPKLVALARAARHHSDPTMRTGSLLLLESIEDLTSYLGQAWLDLPEGAPIEDVLGAYAQDYLRSPARPRAQRLVSAGTSRDHGQQS